MHKQSQNSRFAVRKSSVPLLIVTDVQKQILKVAGFPWTREQKFTFGRRTKTATPINIGTGVLRSQQHHLTQIKHRRTV